MWKERRETSIDFEWRQTLSLITSDVNELARSFLEFSEIILHFTILYLIIYLYSDALTSTRVRLPFIILSLLLSLFHCILFGWGSHSENNATFSWQAIECHYNVHTCTVLLCAVWVHHFQMKCRREKTYRSFVMELKNLKYTSHYRQELKWYCCRHAGHSDTLTTTWNRTYACSLCSYGHFAIWRHTHWLPQTNDITVHIAEIIIVSLCITLFIVWTVIAMHKWNLFGIGIPSFKCAMHNANNWRDAVRTIVSRPNDA